MPTFRKILLTITFLPLAYSAIVNACDGNGCCEGQGGGISYCDSSIGVYVCRNGDYSTCYCTRHAIMGLEKFKGCCTWHGGVFKTNSYGAVICNDSTVSEICSSQNPPEKIASF